MGIGWCSGGHGIFLSTIAYSDTQCVSELFGQPASLRTISVADKAFDTAVGQEQAQAIPVFGDVFLGFAQGRFGGNTSAMMPEGSVKYLSHFCFQATAPWVWCCSW
jgi:hypothetical protein